MKVIYYESLGSTNDEIFKLAKKGALSGTVVIAKEQSEGRGRHGRSWHSSRGQLALSLLIKEPDWPLANLSILALLSALCVVESLSSLGLAAKIKWPNDIILEDQSLKTLPYFGSWRKVAGILIENSFSEAKLQLCALGIGINIFLDAKLSSLVPHATALELYLPQIDHSSLLNALLPKVAELLAKLKEPQKDLLGQYSSHCLTLGQELSFSQGDQIYKGQAVGLSPSGALIVDDGSQRHVLNAGEVQLLKMLK